MSTSERRWKVVPLSAGQLLDVSPRDVICGGHFRVCNSYKGGGGYDRFPVLAKQYFGEDDHNLQFVVQLYGCNLDCPYCYVTRRGVWGIPAEYSSSELVRAFNETPCTVFHLMGGAPALYIEGWREILEALDCGGKSRWIFHSDLMLSESQYRDADLARVRHPRALYAVNIKGLDPIEYEKNTRKALDERRMWMNLEALERNEVGYYLTFTNVAEQNRVEFWTRFDRTFGTTTTSRRRAEAYSIGLIAYKALPLVDEVPWGRMAR